MSLKRFLLAAVVAAVGFTVSPTSAKADCDCLEDLAHQLTVQMAQLEREYVVSFRGARQYPHGLADLREASALAAHVHDAAHGQYGREHLQADAERLDQAFHHFETVVADMDRHARYGRWGWASQNFRTVMANVGTTIHRLREMALYGCGCSAQVPCAAPSPAVPTGWSLPAGSTLPSGGSVPAGYGSSPWGGGGSGWSWSGGASSSPSMPAVTPATPRLPLPTYQAVPQRSTPTTRGIFFRL